MRKQNPKTCDHCGLIFKSGAGLAMHMRWIDGMEHPMKGRKMTGQHLINQREQMRKARSQTKNVQKEGVRITMECARNGCINTFNVVPSQVALRKYCSKSCLAIDRPRNPMTDEQKEIISKAQKARFAKDPTSNPFYGRTPTNYQGWGHGQFVEGLGFWVRSTWERDYLLALKAANVEFEYEAVRFDLNGQGTYCPDIRLDGKDIYVEITGWDKPGKAEKRKLFQDIYGHPLYVIDQRPTKGHIAEFVALCEGVIRDDVTPCS